MKKIIIVICVISFMFVSVLNSVSAQILDKTVATVNLYKTENISKARLDRQYKFWQQQTGKSPSLDEKKDILEATINDVLIMQAAEKNRVVATKKQVDDVIQLRKQETGVSMSDEDFRELMTKQSGLSWSLIRKQIEERLIQEQYIAQKHGNELKEYDPPTDKEIKDTYEEYATRFTNPAMVRLAHLYFDTRLEGVTAAEQEKKAYALAAQINNNDAMFEKKLDESVDNPDLQGADLGYIIRDAQTKGVLGDDFLGKVFDMNKGQVSGVLKSNSGYHIVKLIDKREPRLLTLKDPILPGESITVEQRIRQLLIGQSQQQKFVSLIQKEVDGLREKAKIKYFPKNL